MSSAGYSNQRSQSPCNWNESTRVSLSALAITVTITAAATGMLPVPRAIAADLPIIKSAVLSTNLDVPWSQPVQVTDPFEGNYLAIFDRHYFYRYFLNNRTRTEVVSLWSPKSIRFLLADSNYGCYSGGYYFSTGLSHPNCVTSNTREVIELFVKLGEQVFRLEGQNSVFAVSDELAKSLQNSPTGNVDIRLVTRSGETVDSQIGKGTVKAWKAIY